MFGLRSEPCWFSAGVRVAVHLHEEADHALRREVQERPPRAAGTQRTKSTDSGGGRENSKHLGLSVGMKTFFRVRLFR